MKGISKYIYKNPVQVAWVGDYANEYRCDVNGEMSAEELWNLAWRKSEKYDIDEPKEFDLHNKYLVNHTKGIAIDMNQYLIDCDNDGWVIHPLSLLTACGNGMGGGDFHDNNCGYEFVGAWCMDTISFEDKLPEGYEIEDIRFMEY